MSWSLRRTLVAVSTSFATLSHAISLSELHPSVDDVPEPCASIYHQTILGCYRSDFVGGSGCSSACLAGLIGITVAIDVACRGFSAPKDSWISLFQQGNGIQSLCNVVVVTASTSNSAPSIGQSTLVLPSTSLSDASTIFQDTRSPPVPPSSSSTPTAILTASGSPTMTTSTTSLTRTHTLPPSLTMLSSTSPSSTQDSTSTITSTTLTTTLSSASAQTSAANDDNSGGGGDPFSPSGGGTSLTPTCARILLGLTAGVFLLA